jgi:hypothetical protein
MCLVIWAGLYARHVQRVAVVSRGDPAPPLSQGGLLASFFQPGWDFLFACVRWESTAAGFVPLVVLAAALAIAGACTLKGAALRVLVGGSTLGVLVLLLLVGTPGVFSEGSRSGYWGYLFVPLVLAWSPLGLRAWSGKPSQK